MKLNLIEICGDYYRSDLVAAITIEDDEESEGAWIRVFMIGSRDPISNYFETRTEAEPIHLKAVHQWLDELKT